MEVDEQICEDKQETTSTQAFLSLAAIVGLNIPDDPSKVDESFFADFKQKVLEFLQSAKAYTPQPLLKQSLSTDEWEALEKHSNDMYNDFQERASVLIKRLEVTVESFFWSERVKKLEPEVKAVYEPLKAGLPLPHRVYPEDVISASTELLKVEKTSSASLIKGTKSSITELTVKQKPIDRGGRTNEMMALPRESFQQQQQQREEQSARGGRGRGRGGGGSGSFGNRGSGHGQSGNYSGHPIIRAGEVRGSSGSGGHFSGGHNQERWGSGGGGYHPTGGRQGYNQQQSDADYYQQQQWRGGGGVYGARGGGGSYSHQNQQQQYKNGGAKRFRYQ